MKPIIKKYVFLIIILLFVNSLYANSNTFLGPKAQLNIINTETIWKTFLSYQQNENDTSNTLFYKQTFWINFELDFNSLSLSKKVEIIQALWETKLNIKQLFNNLPETVISRLENILINGFNCFLSETAKSEGINLDSNPHIGLFIGGPHVSNKYYYHLFDDIVRKNLQLSNLVYLPMPIEKEKTWVLDFVKFQMKKNPKLVGSVITRPWKESFKDFNCPDDIKPLGAVNFVVKNKNNITATAIDGEAWINGLKNEVDNYTLSGKNIVIIGSGGATKEIAGALKGKGVYNITFSDINKDTITDLVRIISEINVDYKTNFILTQPNVNNQNLNNAIKNADIVINATGIGRDESFGISPLVDATHFQPHQIVSDLISNVDTQFLKDARKQGVRKTFFGKEMFIEGMVQFMYRWISALHSTPPSNLEKQLHTAISEYLEMKNKADKIKAIKHEDNLKVQKSA